MRSFSDLEASKAVAEIVFRTSKVWIIMKLDALFVKYRESIPHSPDYLEGKDMQMKPGADSTKTLGSIHGNSYEAFIYRKGDGCVYQPSDRYSTYL